MTKFEEAIAKIDKYNQKDPNFVIEKGEKFPKEYLDSIRQSNWLFKLNPDASDELKIAVRGQHIGRWKIPRDSYPETRTGYLNWRTDLAQFHAETTSSILTETGYDQEFIDKVKNLNLKKGIKLNAEAQTLEDVLCLVFLEYHISDFCAQHPKDKLLNIIQKTWKKMGKSGQEHALKLSYDPAVFLLIKEALSL